MQQKGPNKYLVTFLSSQLCTGKEEKEKSGEYEARTREKKRGRNMGKASSTWYLVVQPRVSYQSKCATLNLSWTLMRIHLTSDAAYNVTRNVTTYSIVHTSQTRDSKNDR